MKKRMKHWKINLQIDVTAYVTGPSAWSDEGVGYVTQEAISLLSNDPAIKELEHDIDVVEILELAESK